MLLIQTDRETLLKALQSVTGIVERRHTLPILSNVLLEGNPSQLSLTATDLEIQVKANTVEAKLDKPFAVNESWLGFPSNSTLESIGSVCRRSTMPVTDCKALSKVSRSVCIKSIYISF